MTLGPIIQAEEINMAFYIISHEDEKFTAVADRLKTALKLDGKLPCYRINITPENCPEEIPSWWTAMPDRWALCCAIREALCLAIENDEDCELYEQDAVFCEDFKEKRLAFLSALPDDWDMAYLGGQLLASNFYPLQEVKENDQVLLCKNAHRNHAWICRRSSIPRLLEWLEGEKWPCKHTTDWRIGYLQMKDDFKVYIPKNGWLAGQGAGLSTLDKVETPERWWHFTEKERAQEIERWREFETARKEAAEKARYEAWKAEMEKRSRGE